MTVQDAADILGVSASRVYAMCRDGVLDSRNLGNAVMVNAKSVGERQNAEVRPGRSQPAPPRAASWTARRVPCSPCPFRARPAPARLPFLSSFSATLRRCPVPVSGGLPMKKAPKGLIRRLHVFWCRRSAYVMPRCALITLVATMTAVCFMTSMVVEPTVSLKTFFVFAHTSLSRIASR